MLENTAMPQSHIDANNVAFKFFQKLAVKLFFELEKETDFPAKGDLKKKKKKICDQAAELEELQGQKH